MADSVPDLYSTRYKTSGSAEVPAATNIIEFTFVGEDFMYDPYDIKPSDPLMSSKLPPLGAVGGVLYGDPAASSSTYHHTSQQRLGDSSTGLHNPFLSNNFWLNQQNTTAQAGVPTSMAFQPVSIANQLPPVGAEYQIQTGMDHSLASPYSPESEGSYDDPNDSFQLHLPPGFDKEPITKLTEEQLVSLSARDLNTICRDLPEDVVKQLKKRRRTLKNRGYAYNSRVRRVSQKNQLEKERDELQKQIAQLQDKVKTLEREADAWKRKAQMMERGDLSRQV